MNVRFFLLLILSIYPFAEASAKSTKKTKLNLEKRSDRKTKNISSRKMRKNIKSTIAAEVMPINSLLIPAVGFTFSSYYKPDVLLELHYSKGSLSLQDGLSYAGYNETVELPFFLNNNVGDVQEVVDSALETRIFHSLTTARAKVFHGNSFYGSYGMGQRTIGLSYPIEQDSLLDEFNAVLVFETYGFEFGLGNQWQIDSYAINVKWTSCFVPISGLSQSDREDSFLKNVLDLANSPSLSLFQFGLGYSF